MSTALARDLRAALAAAVFDDEPSLVGASEDFGRLQSHRPQVVVRPQSAAEIAILLRYANDHGLRLSTRGAGHSSGGQTLGADIVLDTSRCRGVRVDAEANLFHSQAGATWTEVIDNTLPLGLCPPVLTNYSGVTVSGTHAVGGSGASSFRRGLQINHCVSCEVVTPLGEIVECNERQNRELMTFALGGLGLFGVMTRVTHRLVPLIETDLVRLHPANLATLLDFADVLSAWPGATSTDAVAHGKDDGFRPELWVSLDGDNFHEAHFRARLGYAGKLVHRRATATALVTSRHGFAAANCAPWMDVFLPAPSRDVALALIAAVPAWLRPYTRVVPLGIAPRPVSINPLAPPPSERLLSILPSVPPELARAADDAMAELGDAAQAAGGTRYLSGRLRLDWQEWKKQCPDLAGLRAAKRRYDPGLVLNPAFDALWSEPTA